MSDPDQPPSDQLDQLFAVPGAAPVPPAPSLSPVLPAVVLPDPNAGQELPPPKQLRKQRVISFQDLLDRLTPRAWVTPTLLALNVGYYLLMVIRGVDPLQPEVPQLLEWGANYAPLTWKNEPWRLLSNLFIHCGILHLALNMWALWSAGRLLERLVGSTGYLIIYFASGIAGSLASLWWNGDVVSAGASGAIFGILGAFATFIWNRADSFPLQALSQLRNSLAMCIGYNLLFGASIQGIDQAAHIGGLLCGLICGLLLSQPLDQFTSQRRFKKNVITACIAVLTLQIMIMNHPPPPPDLFQELTIYDKLVPQTLQNFDAAATKFNEKKLTAPQLVELIQKEILPPWKQVHEHVDTLTNVPSGRRELIHQIRSQLTLREESWNLLIESLEQNDKEKFSEYKDKWDQAEQLNKQLQAQP